MPAGRVHQRGLMDDAAAAAAMVGGEGAGSAPGCASIDIDAEFHVALRTSVVLGLAEPGRPGRRADWVKYRDCAS